MLPHTEFPVTDLGTAGTEKFPSRVNFLLRIEDTLARLDHSPIVARREEIVHGS